MALAATIRINVVKQAEAMLFELRVLECLLADTVQYFEARAHRLEFLMESVLTEVRASGVYMMRQPASTPARSVPEPSALGSRCSTIVRPSL